MPRPPLAACGDDSLYVCERCGNCPTHDRCQPPPPLVSINSRKAAEAIRKTVRERDEKHSPASPGTAG